MVDVVTTQVVRDGTRRKVYHFTNQSDGTGEAGVIKVDISTLTDAEGVPATYSAIDRILYDVGGISNVELAWDHTADDTIAVMTGRGTLDWTSEGGLVDPRSAGGTGDIVLTTTGATAGGSYDLTVTVRPKA